MYTDALLSVVAYTIDNSSNYNSDACNGEEKLFLKQIKIFARSGKVWPIVLMFKHIEGLFRYKPNRLSVETYRTIYPFTYN